VPRKFTSEYTLTKSPLTHARPTRQMNKKARILRSVSAESASSVWRVDGKLLEASARTVSMINAPIDSTNLDYSVVKKKSRGFFVVSRTTILIRVLPLACREKSSRGMGRP